MIRCAEPAMVALALASAAMPARADCFDWAPEAGTVIEQGVLRGLPSGPLRWRIGLGPAHGIHQPTAVEVAWTARDGRTLRQTLFEAMQDGRAVLRLRRGVLELRVTYCLADGACRDTALAYRWDRATQGFAGASQAARASLAAACGAEPASPAGTP
jgi:hypothetical protein